MDYFFLILSVSLGTATSLFSRIVKKGTNRLSLTSATNTITFFVALLTIFSFGVLPLKSEFFTALSSVNITLAIAYGVCLMMAQFSFLLAVGRGPVSVSTLFYSCGFLLPTVYGVLRFGEPVRLFQIVGVSLIVLSFILSTDLKAEKKKADFLWLLFALGGLVFSGGIGIVQKEYALVSSGSIDCFLFCSFAFATLFSLLLTAILYLFDKKKNEMQTNANVLRAVYGSLVLGAVMGGANKLNTYLAGVFASVITFPIVNGGRILITTVLGAILFREKTNLRQKIGILCGFIAIALIAI